MTTPESSAVVVLDDRRPSLWATARDGLILAAIAAAVLLWTQDEIQNQRASRWLTKQAWRVRREMEIRREAQAAVATAAWIVFLAHRDHADG